MGQQEINRYGLRMPDMAITFSTLVALFFARGVVLLLVVTISSLTCSRLALGPLQKVRGVGYHALLKAFILLLVHRTGPTVDLASLGYGLYVPR